MKLALLGVDPESLRLAEAALKAGHKIVWPADLAAAGSSPQTWTHGHLALRTDAWEDLYDPKTGDAIIVGAGPDDDIRGRQVQELARMGRPMLVTFPAFRSVLTYYEIDMARSESGAVLQHFNPLLEAPLLEEAAAWIGSGRPAIGPVEQIVCTRSLSDRSRERVLWHFPRDVELLGRLAGRLNRIGAHGGAGGDAAAYAALSVQLVGPSELPVRWVVEPPVGEEGLNVTFVGQRGRLALAFNRFDQLIGVVQPQASDAIEQPAPEYDPAARAIARFVAAAESGSAAASTWPNALHAMELADSIEISLRRGRMIDVHEQQLTEHLAFKGTMAAVGCGVLVVVIPLMLLVGWIAGQLGIPVADYWPHALLVLLALFLGLQVLPKLLYREPQDKK